MRFSIKWLMAAVTYAAFACASAAYPSPGWHKLLSASIVVATVVSAIGLLTCRGAARAWHAGFLVACLAAQYMAFGAPHAVLYPIQFPNALSVQDATLNLGKRFTGSPTSAAGIVQDYLKNRAEVASIQQVMHLPGGNSIITYTSRDATTGELTARRELRVPTTQFARYAYQEGIAVALRYHFVLLVSILGGLLGIWFYRREANVNPPPGTAAS